MQVLMWDSVLMSWTALWKWGLPAEHFTLRHMDLQWGLPEASEVGLECGAPLQQFPRGFSLALLREMWAKWIKCLSSITQWFVNYAETEEAQNLALVLHEGRIYYRVCRPIYPAEELVVWHQDSTCGKLKEEGHGHQQSQTLNSLPAKHVKRDRETGIWNALPCQENRDTSEPETNESLPVVKSEFSMYEEKLHREHPGFQEGVLGRCGEPATENVTMASVHASCSGEHVTKSPSSPLNNPSIYRPSPPPSPQKTSAAELPLCKKPSRFSLGKSLKCDYCGQLFSRRVQLRNHLCARTGEKPHVCKTCGYDFFTNLNGHMQVHASSRSHVCSKSFQRAHLCGHTGEKSYTCDQCNKHFEDSFTLEKHRLSTSDAKSAVLQDVTHNSQFGTNEHEQAEEWEAFISNPHPHHKSKPSSGGPKFTTVTKIVAQNELRRNPRKNAIHRPVADVSRTHSCELCGKTFSRKHFLTQHLRTHTGEKPYTCPVCEKSFSAKSNLTEHVKIHTGERPFMCSLCSKSFHRSTHLRAHLRCHSGERPYQCQGCNRTFTRRSALKKHRMSLSACCKTASMRKSLEGSANAQGDTYKDSGSFADQGLLETEAYATDSSSQPLNIQQKYHLISQNGNYINGTDLKMT